MMTYWTSCPFSFSFLFLFFLAEVTLQHQTQPWVVCTAMGMNTPLFFSPPPHRPFLLFISNQSNDNDDPPAARVSQTLRAHTAALPPHGSRPHPPRSAISSASSLRRVSTRFFLSFDLFLSFAHSFFYLRRFDPLSDWCHPERFSRNWPSQERHWLQGPPHSQD